jgi:hypothetical protein
VLLDFWERKLKREYKECFRWRGAVVDHIRDVQPELVLVGSTRDYELWREGRAVRIRDIYPVWQEGLTAALAELSDAADRVVLLAETPYLTFDPVDCLADTRIETCDPLTEMVVDDAYATLETSAAEAAGADVLDATALLCPGRTCPVVVGGTVVFRDTNHVTASYMEQLASPIGNLLEGRQPYPLPSPSANASANADAATATATATAD